MERCLFDLLNRKVTKNRKMKGKKIKKHTRPDFALILAPFSNKKSIIFSLSQSFAARLRGVCLLYLILNKKVCSKSGEEKEKKKKKKIHGPSNYGNWDLRKVF